MSNAMAAVHTRRMIALFPPSFAVVVVHFLRVAAAVVAVRGGGWQRQRRKTEYATIDCLPLLLPAG